MAVMAKDITPMDIMAGIIDNHEPGAGRHRRARFISISGAWVGRNWRKGGGWAFSSPSLPTAVADNENLRSRRQYFTITNFMQDLTVEPGMGQ